jgi:hypothetical protein
MSEEPAKLPFLATPNGLITLLVLAAVFPVILPLSGIVVSLTVPLMVCAIVWMRPELGRRWYVLAALPMLVWGYAAVLMLFFR